MKFKLLSLIFLSSSMLLANNFHNQLIIPSVNIDNPFWEFAGQAIFQKEENSFALLITKWNDALDILWKKINSKIGEDCNASTDIINFYMKDQRFIDAYVNYYKKVFANILDDEQEIGSCIANFIHLKLYYLQCNKAVRIYRTENISVPAISFGTDKEGHILILNKDMYNNEKIQHVYELASKNVSRFYVAPHTNIHRSRVIEYANLLHLGIAQAVSSIVHQEDYFSKLLQIFIYNNKTLTQETQRYSTDYVQFHSLLEACLQSNNPYEAALFLEPLLDQLDQEFVLLWRDFIEDIKNCYDPDDLEVYENLSLKERRAILYTMQDNDNE